MNTPKGLFPNIPYSAKDTTGAHLVFLATQAALRAGNVLLKGFGTNFTVSAKPGVHNWVTDYDHAAEACIIDCVRASYPQHAFLAEESGFLGEEQHEVLWVVDPLDGTTNFAHHIPLFAVSIAVIWKKELVCGVIFQPMTAELFVALKGHGAYLNGTRLQVSTTAKLADALLATGYPYSDAVDAEVTQAQFMQMAKIGAPFRDFGSAAIDFAYLAAGRFDGFWMPHLCAWDLAAGTLLVEEAGGKVSDYQGNALTGTRDSSAIAGNKELHPQILQKLKKP
jgi:myo-inositol-1(or 4)-monophosphatase